MSRAAGERRLSPASVLPDRAVRCRPGTVADTGGCGAAKSLRKHPLSGAPGPGRRRRRTSEGVVYALFLLVAVFAGTGCGERSDTQIARRILENHRRSARVKPLAAAQVIRFKLSTPPGREPAEGTGQIAWDGPNYRETIESAGWTRSRGIQGGKAFLTDEDGVTRVASEPVLSELLTRSYFWRRAYLFDDLERAQVAGLGPADAATVSVRLTPRGGNPLLLTFSNAGELVAARSPRFDLRFKARTRATDASDPKAPVEIEIRSTALPSDQMADTQVGGWSARWSGAPGDAPLLRLGRALAVEGRFAGHPLRIAIDAGADGPLRVAPGIAREWNLGSAADVLGRRIGRGGPLEIGTLSYPALFFEVSDEVPEGAQARAGAVFFRETVVELDPANARVRFHDPNGWTAPAGFYRGLLDDDGDRPVAVLRQGSRMLRLRSGTDAGPVIVLAPESARRMELSAPGAAAAELKWGSAPIPTSPVAIAPGFEPEWGDDGALGFDLLLRFHTYLDMPRRWAYLRPLEAAEVTGGKETGTPQRPR